MITVMISGTLAKQPEQRTSKNGNQFAVSTIRIPCAEGDVYSSITAFGDLAGTLAGMQKGDSATIIGQGKITTYTAKDGDHRAGLSITASRIVAVTDHQSQPRPKKGNGQQRYRRTEEFMSAGPREFAPDEFTDSVPF